MKTVIVIWLMAMLTGAGTLVFINTDLNNNVRGLQAQRLEQLQPVQPVNLGTRGCLQNCQAEDYPYQFQDAAGINILERR